MDIPATHYAKSGNVHIAYQVLGDGPIDLVHVPPFISNLELQWRDHDHARYFRRSHDRARGQRRRADDGV